MKLGESPRPHIRNVHVPDFAFRAFVHVAPVALDPCAIAELLLTRECFYGNATFAGKGFDDDRDFTSRSIDQRSVRRKLMRERSAADCNEEIAFAHAQSRFGERG